MDQKKTGAFIAQCRKEKNLTQMQLAELLEITNQAVSKWETGRGLPDVSLLQPLCDVLGISINELLSGEHIPAEEYRVKAEENISQLFKEKQMANRKPVKDLFSVCAKMTLLVAAIELAVGFVGQFFSQSIWRPMLINALVWLGLFALSYGKLSYDKHKLKRLKNTGLGADAEIAELIPAMWVRVANFTTCRAVCRFTVDHRDYRAISSYYVLSPFKRKEDLFSKVYFDPDNPARCSVELFQ